MILNFALQEGAMSPDFIHIIAGRWVQIDSQNSSTLISQRHTDKDILKQG